MSSIYVRYGSPPERHPAVVLIGAAVGLAVIGIGIHFLLRSSLPRLPFVAGGLGYLLVAYLVHPQADTDDLGWFGGLVDDPFKFSDGLNRTLLWLMVVLLPGRLIAESLVGALLLPFRGRSGDTGETRRDVAPWIRDDPDR